MDRAEGRKLLERERERLRELQADQHEQVEEADRGDEVDLGDADAAADLLYRETERTLGTHVETELAEVNHALERLEQGRYGLCEVCGCSISDERLRALPATRFCKEHAELAGRQRRAAAQPQGGGLHGLE